MTAPWPAIGTLNWSGPLYAYISGPGQNPITGMFHADAYGDQTLKTSNINLALADARVAGGVVYVRAGVWTADAVINMSSIPYFDGSGLTGLVKLKGAGHQITRIQSTSAIAGFGFLEVVGSARTAIEGIMFEDKLTTLAYGILGGRPAAGDSVDGVTFHDIWVTGTFSLAGIIMYAAEQAHYQNVSVNTQAGPAMVLARDQRNWTFTAKYTQPVAATPFSGGEGLIRVDRCQFTTARNATTGPGDYPFVLEFAQTFEADSLYTISGGAPLIVMDKRIDQATFRGVHQEWLVSLSGATEPVGFYFKSTATAGESLIARVGIYGSAIYSVFGEDNVTLTSLRVQNSGWRSSTKTWQADIWAADTVDLPIAGAGYTPTSTGEVTTPAYRTRSGAPIVNSTPHQILRGSATLDFPSIAANSASQLNITVTGARTGDDATAHFVGGTANGTIATAWVSANDTVAIRLQNCTTAAIDPPSQTVRVNVFRFQ